MANMISVAVSIPHNYGIGGVGKPSAPKMIAHRWALNKEDLDPVMKAIGEFNYFRHRHRYITDALVQDFAGDIDLSSVKQLFIVIEGVVHARRDDHGVSWWAAKAFIKKENAEDHVKNNEFSDSYLWAYAVERLGGYPCIFWTDSQNASRSSSKNFEKSFRKFWRGNKIWPEGQNKPMRRDMKFVIKRSVDGDGNVDFFCWVDAATDEDSKTVAEIEFKKEDDHYISVKSMGVIRALMEIGDGDDSFSRAIAHLIQEAFKAGMNYALAKDELAILVGDLIKIARARKDGHACAGGELERVIICLKRKIEDDERYVQSVID